MSQLDLLIPATVQRLRMPQEPIIRDADISEVAPGWTVSREIRRWIYRWTARRAWGSGPCILWNLLNPSKADASIDDPTMLRMMGFSYRWGFGSMIVVNIYPFISSKPTEMMAWRKTWNEAEARDSGYVFEYQPTSFNAWLHNMHKVRKAMGEAKTHVAAWGNGAEAADLESFLLQVGIPVGPDEDTGDPAFTLAPDWKCLGTTGSGAPIHPLARGKHRVPDDATLQSWHAPFGPNR